MEFFILIPEMVLFLLCDKYSITKARSNIGLFLMFFEGCFWTGKSLDYNFATEQFFFILHKMAAIKIGSEVHKAKKGQKMGQTMNKPW